MANERSDHSRSTFGRDYWLRRCEGFRVEGPGGRIGHVRGIRFGSAGEPEVLEVRAGLLGRRTLLISVAEVSAIEPEDKRLVLGENPQLLGDHCDSS
jgi:hypothetical protein